MQRLFRLAAANARTAAQARVQALGGERVSEWRPQRATARQAPPDLKSRAGAHRPASPLPPHTPHTHVVQLLDGQRAQRLDLGPVSALWRRGGREGLAVHRARNFARSSLPASVFRLVTHTPHSAQPSSHLVTAGRGGSSGPVVKGEGERPGVVSEPSSARCARCAAPRSAHRASWLASSPGGACVSFHSHTAGTNAHRGRGGGATKQGGSRGATRLSHPHSPGHEAAAVEHVGAKVHGVWVVCVFGVCVCMARADRRRRNKSKSQSTKNAAPLAHRPENSRPLSLRQCASPPRARLHSEAAA